MRELIAIIYENRLEIYEAEFKLIYYTLFEDGGYTFLGLTILLVPLTMFIAFYFLWQYPYGKLWHWLLWLLITIVLTSGISWGISNNEIFLSDNQELMKALNNQNSGYEEHANTLPNTYAFYNGLFSIVVGFIYSLFMKQFSKIQIHLPF